MQQLYLSGECAGAVAARLFDALNIRPVGCRLSPFEVDGAVRGDAMQLLLPPADPMFNGVPCRILLSPGQSTVVPAALEEIAAPGLLAALRIHAPMLLDGLSADLLENAAFRRAVRECLMSTRPVVVAADSSAVPILKGLTASDKQLWFTVPEDAEAQARLLEALLPEAALRF